MDPVVIVDPIPMLADAATGAIKTLLFGPPFEAPLFHVARFGQGGLGAALQVVPAGEPPGLVAARIAATGARSLYYRPTDDDPAFCEAVEAALDLRADLRLVIHFMDDVEGRAVEMRRPHAEAFLAGIRRLVRRAHRVLAISPAMAARLGTRHGVEAEAVSNAADLGRMPPARQGQRRAFTPDRPFRLRYFGSVSPDMNQASLRLVASACAFIGSRTPFRLEAFVPPWCLSRLERPAWEAPHVRVGGQVPSADLPGAMREADALLIAYNFDALSLSYVRDSIGNKTGDYITADRPIVIVGPREQATVSLLADADAALVLERADWHRARHALLHLAADWRRREALTDNARAMAGAHFNLDLMRLRLRRCFA